MTFHMQVQMPTISNEIPNSNKNCQSFTSKITFYSVSVEFENIEI